MKLIHLTRGQSAKVDDQDFDRFGALEWKAQWCPSTNSFRAVRCETISGVHKLLLLHREVMRAPKGMMVDHINHDTLDCRRGELRVCTRSQNGMNRRGASSNSKSGLLGVYRFSESKWRATIRVKGKTRCLGLHKTKGLASDAYQDAAKKYFGEFAGSL